MPSPSCSSGRTDSSLAGTEVETFDAEPEGEGFDALPDDDDDL